MRKKIIGIFVIMLMIATVVPVTGTLQESEQKNSVLSQNNETDVSGDIYMGIGFGINRKFSWDGNYVYYNVIFALTYERTAWSHRPYFLIYSFFIKIQIVTNWWSNEIRYFGKNFFIYY